MATSPITVGCDISKATVHTAVLFSDNTHVSAVFQNNTDGIECLIHWLTEHQVSKTIPIVIESTGSLHWLPCLLLSEQQFSVRLINPLITKKYQRATIRGAKTDAIDALRLAEIGQIEKSLPLFFDTRESFSRKRYQSLYSALKHAKQQLAASYRDASDAATRVGLELDLSCMDSCVKHLDETIATLKKLITSTASEMAKTLAEMLGISLFQATVLTTAVEGRIFENRDQLTAFFGLDVKKRQSGTWQGCEKLSKRGNPFYRQVLFQLGWSLSRHSEEYQAYYQRLFKTEKKHYYTAILATARKFLRYFFYLLSQKKVSLPLDSSL